MVFSTFKMLNQYDTLEKKVLLYRIHSDEITEFNTYYRYITKRILVLNDETITDQYEELKKIYNQLRMSVLPYQDLLQDISDIRNLFNRLADIDSEEDTYQILKKFWHLISRFRRGEVENKLLTELNSLVDKSSDYTLINYYWQRNMKYPFKTESLNNYLISDHFYDSVFLVASPNYFKNSNTIFKAATTYFISYDIFQSSLSETVVISHNDKNNSGIYTGITVQKKGSEIISRDSEPVEQMKNEYSQFAVEWVKSYRKNIDGKLEDVPAHMLELATRQIILYPLGAKISVLSRETLKVMPKNFIELKLGDWLVIRQSTNEEYIRVKSRERLGLKYDSMIESILEYKKRLQQKTIELGGIDLFKRHLKMKNLNPTRQVLINWIYGETLRPRDDSSYRKLLETLGYQESDFSKMSNDVSQIYAVHQSVGRDLTQDIQKVIDAMEKEKLIESMADEYNLDFTVEGIGSFSIKTIAAMYADEITVESKDLYKLHNEKQNKKTEIMRTEYTKYFN